MISYHNFCPDRNTKFPKIPPDRSFGWIRKSLELVTACLSGEAKLAWRQRGEKNGRKLEVRDARFQCGGSVVVVFAHFFFPYLRHLNALLAR